MTQESQPAPRKAPKISRRTFLGGIAAGALALAGCKPGESASTTSPSTKPDSTSTTIPGITTIPSTESPTTIVEAKPTDVMEVYADGSELLRNGGVLYKGEKNELPEWFGGIEIHITDIDGNKTGFQEGAQNTVLDSILWAFGNQHPEFVSADGQVDIEAYKAYLEQNDWVDLQVFVPDNVSEGRSKWLFVRSPLSTSHADFKQPFIIGNGDLAKIDGFEPENTNYYTTDPGQK